MKTKKIKGKIGNQHIENYDYYVQTYDMIHTLLFILVRKIFFKFF